MILTGIKLGQKITNFKYLIGAILIIATPFIGWPGMEHRAIQMNFSQCGIVLFLSTFLPVPIALFLIYSLINVFMAKGIGTVSFSMFQMLFVGTLFFYFVKESAKRDTETWMNIIAALFLTNIIFVIIQASGHTVYFSLREEAIGSGIVGLPGIMGQRVFQGILCAVAAPLLLKKSFWFAPLILIGLYFSKSTTALAAALAGVLFLYPKKIVFAVTLILMPILFMQKDVHYGLFNINFGQFSTIYEQSWPLIKNHWLGQGIGAFHNARIIWEGGKMWWREAHNEYYQLYFEFGRIGVVLLLWFLFDMIYIFFKSRKDTIINILSASLLAFLISCLGQPVMHVVRIAMVGVIITALIYARSDQLKGT